MYSSISKWINILSILLALLAMGELIFTSTILFLLSTIMCKTGGYATTVCGLTASLICLPTAFKVKSLLSEFEIRVHHFDMQAYQRFLLYISLAVQTICVLFCCITLTQTNTVQSALLSAVMKYQRRYTDKKFVDTVQVQFQCCGIFSYQDWAHTSWVYKNKQEIFCEDEDAYIPDKTFRISAIAEEKNIQYLFSVPYSCCKMQSTSCRHYDLKCSGVSTINTDGCLSDLTSFIISVLFSELLIYLCIIVIIMVLLKLFKMEESELCCDQFEDLDHFEDINCVESKWEKFTNSIEESFPKCDTISCFNFSADTLSNVTEKCSSNSRSENKCSCSDSAELVPTSQEEIVVHNQKVEIVRNEQNFASSERVLSTIDEMSIPMCSCSSDEETERTRDTPTKKEIVKSHSDYCYSTTKTKKVRFE